MLESINICKPYYFKNTNLNINFFLSWEYLIIMGLNGLDGYDIIRAFLTFLAQKNILRKYNKMLKFRFKQILWSLFYIAGSYLTFSNVSERRRISQYPYLYIATSWDFCAPTFYEKVQTF